MRTYTAKEEQQHEAGVSEESAVIDILAEWLQQPRAQFIHSTDRHDIFDCRTPELNIEIKSRFIYSTKFDTTLLAINKTRPMPGKRLLYVFNFIDETRILYYDKALFDTFDTFHTLGKLHYLVPIRLTELVAYNEDAIKNRDEEMKQKQEKKDQYHSCWI